MRVAPPHGETPRRPADRLHQRGEVGTELEPCADSPDVFDGPGKAILVDRFEQVIDSVDLERFNGVLIIRRYEDDRGKLTGTFQSLDHLKTVQARHLYIE